MSEGVFWINSLEPQVKKTSGKRLALEGNFLSNPNVSSCYLKFQNQSEDEYDRWHNFFICLFSNSYEFSRREWVLNGKISTRDRASISWLEVWDSTVKTEISRLISSLFGILKAVWVFPLSYPEQCLRISQPEWSLLLQTGHTL